MRVSKILLNVIIVVTSLVSLVSNVAHAGKQIKIVTLETGYMPYYDETAKYGIFIDFLAEFQKAFPAYEHVFVPTSRKRMDDLFESRSVQVFSFSNLIFYDDDKKDQLLATDAFAEEGSFLFMKKSRVFPYNKPADLFGKTIGVLHGNKSPGIDPYFAQGKILKETPNHIGALVEMAMLDRIDAFFQDKNPGLYAIKTSGYTDLFVVSERTLFSFDQRMLTHKDQEDWVRDFNSFLANTKSTGLINRIIEKYTK